LDRNTREKAAQLAYEEGYRIGFEIGRIESYEERLGRPATPIEELDKLSLEELYRMADELEGLVR